MERTLVFAFKMSSLHWRFTHNTALLQTVLAYQPTVHPYTQRSKGRHLPTCNQHTFWPPREAAGPHTQTKAMTFTHTLLLNSASLTALEFFFILSTLRWCNLNSMHTLSLSRTHARSRDTVSTMFYFVISHEYKSHRWHTLSQNLNVVRMCYVQGQWIVVRQL